jgi:hypothetical protein
MQEIQPSVSNEVHTTASVPSRHLRYLNFDTSPSNHHALPTTSHVRQPWLLCNILATDNTPPKKNAKKRINKKKRKRINSPASDSATLTSRIIQKQGDDRRKYYQILGTGGAQTCTFAWPAMVRFPICPLAKLLRKNYRSREPWNHNITTPLSCLCTLRLRMCTPYVREGERIAELDPSSWTAWCVWPQNECRLSWKEQTIKHSRPLNLIVARFVLRLFVSGLSLLFFPIGRLHGVNNPIDITILQE